MAAPVFTDHDGLDDVSQALAASRLTRKGSSRASSHHAGASRSARIEKPRSIHNSPRVGEKRRSTVTNAGKGYTTLDDHWEMMFGSGKQEEDQEEPEYTPAPRSTRPMSWHPESSAFASFSSPYTSPIENGYDWDATSHANSLAMPPSGRPAYSSQSLLNGGYNFNTAGPNSFNTSPVWDNSHISPLHSMPTASWSVPDWVQMTQSQPSYHNSYPTVSPDDSMHLTQQGSDEMQTEEVDDEEEDDGNVLVGMGLHDDPPQGYDSWFASSTPPVGKGLKLEESWDPPQTPASNDDEEVDDDDSHPEEDESADAQAEDGGTSEGSAEEPPVPTQQGGQMLPPQFERQQKEGMSLQGNNLAGRSFLLDAAAGEEEGLATEWWYQQLRQPIGQRGDEIAALGHGWLRG